MTALLEIQASRARARVGPSVEPVLMLAQDRARWDPVLIRRGLAALARAEACHARVRTAEETDWTLRDEPALAGYHLLPAVRGDFLAKLGRLDEARAELERAAACIVRP